MTQQRGWPWSLVPVPPSPGLGHPINVRSREFGATELRARATGAWQVTGSASPVESQHIERLWTPTTLTAVLGANV